MAVLIREREPVGILATFGIASTAHYFARVTSLEELRVALSFATEHSLRVVYVAGCSNVVFAPEIDALVIQLAIAGFTVSGKTIVVGAGESLLETVHRVNELGLAGMHTLAGIPGTVGGAVVGNAGAYGKELCESISAVAYFDGNDVIEAKSGDCDFRYRHSMFKVNRNLVVLSATLTLEHGDAAELTKKSAAIIEERSKKYPPGIQCPGSFFKNMRTDDLSSSVVSRLPERALVHDKVAVGYLIEAVDGRGLCVGGACVADYHGNLLLNTGSATYGDVVALAAQLKQRVSDRFGVDLEEEIRYIS